MERYKPGKTKAKRRGGDYFPDAGAPLVTFSSGCVGLDCAFGGGWPLGRIVNIVGDKSTGKTLLAIEACANFSRRFPKGKIYYREAESAFDATYAEQLGLPTARIDFGVRGLQTKWSTIEDLFVDLRAKVAEHEKSDFPGLYIVDSLDALTSRAALARDVGEGSFGLEKQKILGQLFEQLTQEFKTAKLTIMIVSQIREKIGFVLGEKYRRSGGKSLDFYASIIVWLAHIKTLTETRRGIKRAVGVQIRANCKKNKVGAPFRTFDFPIMFGYGIDDVTSSVEWLAEVKKLDKIGVTLKGVDAFLDETGDLDDDLYAARREELRKAVAAAWEEVESEFAPTRRKYA